MKRTAWFLFVLLILTNAVSRAEILYCFQFVGPSSNSRLVALDVQNDRVVSESYFPVLDAYMQCAAFDDSSNTLYSWESYSDSLCTIDTITGMHTIIGGSGGLPDDTMVHSLAINPNTNDMFAMSYSGCLYQVDKTNGNRTYIGKVSSLRHVHGFAFSPNGVAYCSDTTISNGSELFTLNTETAEASFVAIIPREYVIALDFNMNGILYGADSELGIINTANGQWTTVTSGLVRIPGMAFGPIPGPSTLRISVDIKPQSCFNSLNLRSEGVLPVAVLGSEDFDVNEIDIASVRLADVAPFRSNYLDITGPKSEEPNACGCADTCPDDYTDLMLKFRTTELAEALEGIYGEIVRGDELELTLTGVLHDGSMIEGLDYITVVGKEPKRLNKPVLKKMKRTK